MKQITFNIQQFTVDPKEPDTYEYWVNLTAKLIKRPYFITHKMVEGWSLNKIIERYNLATKHNGDLPSDVYWFWKRKLDKETK